MDELINQKENVSEDMYSKYGFYVENNSYYSIRDGGKTYQWSNFSMTAVCNESECGLPKRFYKIENQNNKKQIIVLEPKDFISLPEFKQKIEGLGNYVWLATEKELAMLKAYLYELTEMCTERNS